MAVFIVNCFLVAILISSLSLICESEVPKEFPNTTKGIPAESVNSHDVDSGMLEMDIPGSRHREEMSAMIESHLLRMLKLSSRPAVNNVESTVPGYITALRHAIDTVPPATLNSSTNDHLTWAVKAVHVTSVYSVTSVHFNMAGKSREVAPWRVELVFESGGSVWTQSRVRRGRSRVDLCHVTRGQSRTVCRQWRSVRYRRYAGHGHSYSVYDVTTALAPTWSFCYLNTCRLVVRVHGAGHVDVDRTLTILVVYQNMMPDLRATRRALRSGRTQPSRTSNPSRASQNPARASGSPNRVEDTPSRAEDSPPRGSDSSSRASNTPSRAKGTKNPQMGDKRFRRGTDPESNSGYCHLYSWSVDFRALNWTWIVAPDQFQARYCAGMCPRNGHDLERVDLSNHAFVRMAHLAYQFNLDGGRVPAPTCVAVKYSSLNILYRTDNNTFELRSLNEMVSDACGCL